MVLSLRLQIPVAYTVCVRGGGVGINSDATERKDPWKVKGINNLQQRTLFLNQSKFIASGFWSW